MIIGVPQGTWECVEWEEVECWEEINITCSEELTHKMKVFPDGSMKTEKIVCDGVEILPNICQGNCIKEQLVREVTEK